VWVRTSFHEQGPIAVAKEYVQAFAEWDGREDAEFWDRFSGDGITDEAR
jgi:hypothetical protein